MVNGQRIPMLPGDLVLTPNWTWHDHANDTRRPMIWLDGLDSPLIRMLECGFHEEYEAETQPLGRGTPTLLCQVRRRRAAPGLGADANGAVLAAVALPVHAGAGGAGAAGG